MERSSTRREASPEVRSQAERLVQARLGARALPGFPGAVPTDLETAYACQEAALTLWPEAPVGWKVGRVPPALEAQLGDARVCGPIFASGLQQARGGRAEAPVIAGGFAAVEAELAVRIRADAPPGKLDWTEAEVWALIGAVHIAVEIAGSPIPDINLLGSTAVAADFGNNAGLILGPEIADWRTRGWAAMGAETFVDGARVGAGLATGLLGGPLGSLRWLAGRLAARGRPLKADQLISTGALTGVHEVAIGQTARLSFGRDGDFEISIVRAQPRAAATAPQTSGGANEETPGRRQDEHDRG